MPTKIQDNYTQILETLPPKVQLVAVSKTHPAEAILEVYAMGQKVFGENKVQELVQKYEALPKDIRWHLIGHLQTNKVKYIAPFIHLIESVDSEKLLLEINKQAEKNKRKIEVLLQVKIAEEDTKTGMEVEGAQKLYKRYLSAEFPNVIIRGLMGMASFTDNENQIRKEFTFLKNFYDELSKIKPLDILSMGMSGDYSIAIECGSTNVRVGSAIFGSRNYSA